MNPSEPVHVIGATGRTGAVLCRVLSQAGTPVVPVVRDPARWAALGLPFTPRVADLADPPALRAALAGATRIVSVSYAVWTRQILHAAPPAARVVLTGTARRYWEAADPAAANAAAAEALLCASGRDGVMLHPTVIYGAPDDGTVSRLAALIARTRILPLPRRGRTLVQPVHVDDVAAALAAALQRAWPNPRALPIGGPAPLPYAALVAAVAAATGQRCPLIVPIPTALVRLAARPALLRLLSDRTVDPAPMRTLLGITGRSLEQGLAIQFGAR